VLASKDDVAKDGSKAIDPVMKKSETKPKLSPERAEKPVKPSSVEPENSTKLDASKAPLKLDKKSDPAPDESVHDEPILAAVKAPTTTKTDELLRSANAPVRVRDVRGLIVRVAAILVAFAAVIIVVFGVLIYGYKSENPAVKTVASIIPYPVERVNGHFVTYSQYLFEVDANMRAYQNNAKLNNQPAVNFSSADGKKLIVQIKQHALDKLVSDSLTAQLASQKKVTVSTKEVDDLVNQLYQRYGGKDTLLKTLSQIYGWNINDLRGVVYKQLLAKDLETKITADPAVDAAAKAKAQGVVKDLKDGADFTETAKKVSQASDAASGGDLGFFTKGQLPDQLQTAAEALQPGQVSDPVKDQYGYEILKVIEKKDDGSIHAQHILVKTVDFTEYFQAELKKAKVNKYVQA
jgi:parvulin-like peptidyl-prolyl isomerase